LASDLDRLIWLEGVTEQGVDKGIGTYGDECYRREGGKKCYCEELHNFCCFITYCKEEEM
jgi:hypothetical protein